MMGNTLLILGAGPAQTPAIRLAKQLGLRTLAIDPSPEAEGFAFVDERHVFDLADTENCVAVASKAKVNGVLTLGADYPVPMVAKICESLALPGITSTAAARATNKRLMRQALSHSSVPCPASYPAQNLEQALQAFVAISGETIIKPTIGNGGRGITRIHADAPNTQVQAAFERATAFTRGDGVLVEQFVEGPEFSVETITRSGQTQVVAVTDKLTSGYPYYVEVGHSQPTGLTNALLDQVTQTAVAAVEALGIDGSPGHTELRLGVEGPVVMEVGARLGGGYICSDLVPLSLGVDLVQAAIELALDREPNLTPKHRRGAAIRFLQPTPGTIERIEGVQEAQQLSGCHRVCVEAQPGDIIQPLKDSDGRMGYVIFSGQDAPQAIARAEQAKQMIRIQTRTGAK